MWSSPDILDLEGEIMYPTCIIYIISTCFPLIMEESNLFLVISRPPQRELSPFFQQKGDSSYNDYGRLKALTRKTAICARLTMVAGQ